MNNDERNYEELIQDKFNKIKQGEKDIEQIKEKLERASKQVLSYSRELRKTKNVQGPTLEEKDFKLRDLWDFNKNKAKDLIDISIQYPLLQQTLNILFAQVKWFNNKLNFQVFLLISLISNRRIFRLRKVEVLDHHARHSRVIQCQAHPDRPARQADRVAQVQPQI